MAVMNDVTEVLHKIEAKLYPNYLGKGGGAYVARSKAEAPLSIEDICASAKNRGGFTGQYEDLVEHTHVFINEMIYQLLDGFSVQVGGYFSLHTRIGGPITASGTLSVRTKSPCRSANLPRSKNYSQR
ncbi:MAG: hypothetical protein LBG72_01955 [Spirochaetaceae bacterium]|jgi:hypothetical protein|nr:hypothetical protein [Spirochaetaceae bacterium]